MDETVRAVVIMTKIGKGDVPLIATELDLRLVISIGGAPEVSVRVHRADDSIISLQVS